MGEGRIPPAGVHLTDLHVSLAREISAEAEWSSEDASADGTMDLMWQWSMKTDSKVLPLGEQRIRDLPFDVKVVQVESDSLELALDVAQEGITWELPNLLEVRDFEMHLEGVSVSQP